MFSRLIFLAVLCSSSLAHFTLDFPEPRGPFSDEDEVLFCGGHNDAATNRSTFPLSGGFFTVTSGHDFTAGVLLSTVQNPNSFDNFTTSDGKDQLVRNFVQQETGGTYCIPLDLSNTGIDGVQDGANITIQIVMQGSDGGLYQCADLTLSSDFQITEECTNSTSTDHGDHDEDGDEASESDSDAAMMWQAPVVTISLVALASLFL